MLTKKIKSSMSNGLAISILFVHYDFLVSVTSSFFLINSDGNATPGQYNTTVQIGELMSFLNYIKALSVHK